MPNANLTEVIAILDRSGSMYSSLDYVIEGFNAFVLEQKEVKGECRFTLVGFDSYGTWPDLTPVIETIYEGVDVQKVPLLNDDTYFARGGTPLNDAIGLSIDRAGERFAAISEKYRPGKVIVFVSTDGMENASKEFPGVGNENVRAKVKHQEDKYNWQFVFTAGDLDAYATGAQLGVASGMILNSGKSEAGLRALYSGFSKKTTAFRMGDVEDMSYSASEKKEIESHSTVPKKGSVGEVKTVVNPFNVTDLDFKKEETEV